MSLKKKRHDLRLSQTRLARLAAVSRFKIALYELGDGELTPGEVARIEAAFTKEAARLRSALDHIEQAGQARAVASA